MRQRTAHPVAAIFKLAEQLRNGRMIDGAAFRIGQQIALTDIGDIAFILILREEMIERLVAHRADVFWNGLIPLLAIGEDRVDIENNAAEIEQPVPDHITDAKAGAGLPRGVYQPPCLC